MTWGSPAQGGDSSREQEQEQLWGSCNTDVAHLRRKNMLKEGNNGELHSCYWVGSLDFNVSGHLLGFSMDPQKLFSFCRGVNSHRVSFAFLKDGFRTKRKPNRGAGLCRTNTAWSKFSPPQAACFAPKRGRKSPFESRKVAFAKGMLWFLQMTFFLPLSLQLVDPQPVSLPQPTKKAVPFF